MGDVFGIGIASTQSELCTRVCLTYVYIKRQIVIVQGCLSHFIAQLGLVKQTEW